MYKRFRALDRGRKGYISGDEFINIPELSINPIAQVRSALPYSQGGGGRAAFTPISPIIVHARFAVPSCRCAAHRAHV